MTLGEYIKDYRLHHGMSIRDFAKESGISKSWVSLIEKGKNNQGETIVPSFKLIKMVADATGTTIDDLAQTIDGLVSMSDDLAQPMTDREILKVIIDELPDEKVHALLSMLR